MEQYLAEQYLTRIGYVSGPEHGYQEPDPETRSNIRPATLEEIQPMMNSLEEQYAAQRLAPSTISSRPATQTRGPYLREEASSPSILYEIHSTTSTTSTEASHQPPKPKHKPKSPSAPPPPPPQTKAQILARLHSELERRQKTCVGIEHQLETCQTEIRTLPSKQKKVAKEHEKRLTELLKLEHAKRQIKATTEQRQYTQTAEEAHFEEMRNIYQQYERESTGVPTAESVDAFFVIVADTEHHVKKAEEANKAAKRRGGKLEERLYKARCAVFEMEGEVEEMESGGKEASESNVEGDWRTGGYKEGKKKKRRRGKGKKDR